MLDDWTEPLRAFRILTATPASADDLAMVLAHPRLASVEALLFPNCAMNAESVRAIARASLPELRMLDLRRTGIGDAGASVIATSSLAGRLTWVGLAGSFLHVGGLRALLGSALGLRPGSLHLEEEDQPESLIPSLMNDLFATSNGDARASAEAFETILAHPALTTETKDELRYQWDLVMSSG